MADPFSSRADWLKKLGSVFFHRFFGILATPHDQFVMFWFRLDYTNSSFREAPALQKVAFDPTKQFTKSPPKKGFKMQEIGRGNQGVSLNAESEPLPLYGEEAIKQMRSAILSKPVLEDYQCSFSIAAEETWVSPSGTKQSFQMPCPGSNLTT